MVSRTQLWGAVGSKKHLPEVASRPITQMADTKFTTSSSRRHTMSELSKLTRQHYDVTMEGLNWMVQVKPPIQGFSLGLVMGPRFAEMAVNFARNLREGRARLVMGVCTAAN
jgi:hypothetical protein